MLCIIASISGMRSWQLNNKRSQLSANQNKTYSAWSIQSPDQVTSHFYLSRRKFVAEGSISRCHGNGDRRCRKQTCKKRH